MWRLWIIPFGVRYASLFQVLSDIAQEVDETFKSLQISSAFGWSPGLLHFHLVRCRCDSWPEMSPNSKAAWTIRTSRLQIRTRSVRGETRSNWLITMAVASGPLRI